MLMLKIGLGWGGTEVGAGQGHGQGQWQMQGGRGIKMSYTPPSPARTIRKRCDIFEQIQFGGRQ